MMLDGDQNLARQPNPPNIQGELNGMHVCFTSFDTITNSKQSTTWYNTNKASHFHAAWAQ